MVAEFPLISETLIPEINIGPVLSGSRVSNA
jgi:hypothetical protein